MNFKKWAIRAILFAPGIFLIAGATMRFESALAIERAFPVPDYLKLNGDLPPDVFRRAYFVLASANPEDGDTGVLRSEAGTLAGIPAAEIIPDLETALRHAPSNARGWTLLAELLTPTNPMRAADMLAVALELSPSNYWLAARQAHDGVGLWPFLSEQTKVSLVRQARVLWTEQDLRPEIRYLLEEPGGFELIARVFAQDPDGLRALNRWLAADRRRTTAGVP